MFDWTVLASGAIGVAGTGLGAWLAGKSQASVMKLGITAENERHRLTNKQEVYTRFLASLADALAESTRLEDLRANLRQGADLAEVAAVRSALANARRDLISAWATLDLIAPNSVTKHAFKLCELGSGYAWCVMTRKDNSITIEEVNKLRNDVALVMRADLTEPDDQ
jgi:hypothetical protein